jgi:hypothetical protein
MKKDPNVYPPGFDRKKVEAIIAHYENQSDEEAAAEDEAAFAAGGQTVMKVPLDLVPVIRELIAKRKRIA